MLSKEILVELPGGRFRKLGGGISNQVIDRCFQRMCGWLASVVATINAEFPDFEAASAFECFSLRPRLAVPELTERFNVLTRVFGGQAPELLREFEDYAHFAARVRRTHAHDPGSQ
jgi:hypothetical protein